jgi:hypothetical protein
MSALTDIYERLTDSDAAMYQIRKMLAEGKPDRAKMIVMTFATQWDIYLHTDEAMEILEMFENSPAFAHN